MNTKYEDQITLSEAITYLGTDQVAHCLAADNPLAEIAARAVLAYERSDYKAVNAFYKLTSAVPKE